MWEWWNYQSLETNYNFLQFKHFLLSNGIIGTAAGVVIAYSAWDTIKSLIGDVLLPSFYFIFIFPFVDPIKDVSLVFMPIQKVNIPNFTKNLFSFIMMLIITFWVIRYITVNWTETASHSMPTEEIQQEDDVTPTPPPAAKVSDLLFTPSAPQLNSNFFMIQR